MVGVLDLVDSADPKHSRLNWSWVNLEKWSFVLVRASWFWSPGGKQGGWSRRWAAAKGGYGPWLHVATGSVWPCSPALEVAGLLQLLVLFHQPLKLRSSAMWDLLRKLSSATNYSCTCSIRRAEPFGWVPKRVLAACDSAVAKLMSALLGGKSTVFLFT